MTARFSPALFRWFAWYSRRYLQRHFHAVRLLRGGAVPASGRAILFFANHASWWDPLVALFITRRLFPDRVPRAPIDADALARYRFFERLGFFGVEQGSRRGAVDFVRTGGAVLRDPRTVLWLTPQARFADVRERPVRFAAGLGHLALRGTGAVAQPMAAEYVFWEEKRPEILLAFGEAVTLPEQDLVTEGAGRKDAAEEWTARFEAALTALQDRLGAAAIRRQPEDFDVILRGRGAMGGVYDLWRRLRARLRGEVFRPEHGRK